MINFTVCAAVILYTLRKSVFLMLEPENPTFLMTAPVEKPLLILLIYT